MKPEPRRFQLVLQSFLRNPGRFQRQFKNVELTMTERALLDCWLKLRDNDYEFVLTRLDRIPVQTDPLLEGQRLLLRGITLNNKSEPKKAVELILKSIELMSSGPFMDLLFHAGSNLFIAQLNCKNPSGMESALKLQSNIHPLSPQQSLTIRIEKLNYQKFMGELEKAEKTVQSILSEFDQMTESQLIQFQLSRFDLEVKRGRLDLCEVVLKELKKLKKFTVTANYRYMRILLDHLLNGKTVYAYARDFSNFPNLESQIQVIQNLESGQRQQALIWWSKLMQKNPETYRPNFDYRGDVCLFSMALKRFLHQHQPESGIPNDLPDRKDHALIELLKASQSPLTKEFLFLKLWGVPPKDKSEFNRLERIVSRVRKSHDCKIISKKGSYLLVKK